MKTMALLRNGDFTDTESAEKLSDDVLTILSLHEKAGWRKTGTGDVPLNTVYDSLTGARWANFRGCWDGEKGVERRWSFPGRDRFHGPKIVLREILEALGFEVYADESGRRGVVRVRLGEDLR